MIHKISVREKDNINEFLTDLKPVFLPKRIKAVNENLLFTLVLRFSMKDFT